MILNPDVYTKAHKDTAVAMTMELRQEALNAGWHPEVVSNMHVSHEANGYKVNIHPDYADRAHVHEYGTEGVRPTAVIRKYNRPEAGSEAFMRSLKHHAKDGKK